MNGTTESFGQIVTTLTRVLITPASNIKVAILLYTTIGVLLLLVLVIGVMFIMSAPDDDAAEDAPRESRRVTKPEPSDVPPASPRRRWLLGGGIAALLVCVWVVTGFTTSDSGLCKSCHWQTSEHAKADAAADPHKRVECVECHEAGGAFGRYVTVPFRALHLVMASGGGGGDHDYGRVTVRACTACHADALPETITNAERGLRMSHAEPVSGSARCVDCHARRNGIVSVHNAGMKPCLRCHDGDKVSSKCDTCHQGAVAAATRARTTSFRSAQIQDVSCSGCHNEKQDCDPCHKTRMPHTGAFKAGAHARAGAVDLWYGGGKACGQCHTSTRRPCGRCHTQLLGKAHGVSMSGGHQGSTASHCNTCHLEYAAIATRDFCKDVCHSAAAKAASPR